MILYRIDFIPLVLTMIEDSIFDDWNYYKKHIDIYGANEKYQDLYINPWEIWYVTLWKNIWTEIHGKDWFKRPVLVCKKLWSLFLCIPLTTKIKHTIFHYQLISWRWYKPSCIIISQIRTIDKRRFLSHLDSITKEELSLMKKRLKEFYFPDAL